MITPQTRLEPGELCRRVESAVQSAEGRALYRLLCDLNGLPRSAATIEVSRRTPGSPGPSAPGAAPTAPAAGSV